MTRQSTRFQCPKRAAVLAFATLVFLAPDSRAQESLCLDREKLAQALDGRYSEKPVAAGLNSAGKLLEVFASGDGASWTMIVTTPEGVSCVIATGEQWLSSEKPLYDPAT